jgi:DNA-binding NarL/FixJ family response regulator
LVSIARCNSTIEDSLPQRRTAEQLPVTNAMTVRRVEPGASGRGRVVFADDDQMVLEATSAALSLAGFEVTAVSNASEALEVMAVEAPDVLLIDIDMPGNQNLELLQAMADRTSFVSCVILTGYPTLATAVGAVRMGAVDYMTKPPVIEELLRRLDAAVHRVRVLRSIDEAVALARELSRRLESLNGVIRQGPGARLAGASSRDEDAASLDPLYNLSPQDLGKLTPRERQVMSGLAMGHSPQKIGEAMRLSTNTVRNHLKSIFVKLGVNSQVALLSKLTLRR